MPPTPAVLPDIVNALAAETRRLFGLGFMACTGGNTSVRLSENPLTIAMSPSGIDKGTLVRESFVRLDGAGRVLDGDTRRPSDETELHLAFYREFGVGAVCHGHLVHAVALSLDADQALVFSGIEMQKAFAGTATHACVRRLPVIENSQSMTELARSALAARDEHVPAILVRGHGVYAWGRTPAEAGRHLETVEWLCRITWIHRTMGGRVT